MRREAANFYSRYPGQSWKNLLSFGDAGYERDAMQEVAFCRCRAPAYERLRTKAVTLPANPTALGLAVSLRLLGASLRALARFDGELDISASSPDDILPSLAAGLCEQRLAEVALPSPDDANAEADLSRALGHMAEVLRVAPGA